MRVHLIDGTYELFRCFYGGYESQHDGVEVGATKTLLSSLLALLVNDGATHVGVAFDTVIESFRNDLFAGYKTGDGIDPQLWAQFPLAEEATEALGVVTWRMREFEADDAIAAFAARAAADPRVEQVLVCTPDKDLAQCVVGQRVVMYDRRKKEQLDEDGVKAKYGVPPVSIPDLLALVGDDADGIPGLPGFGMKGAGAVLSRYGSIDAIPAAGAWDVKVRGGDKLAATLHARRADAALYKKLATLRLDVPLTESVDDLEWRGADRAKLTALAAKLGDDKIVERVSRFR